jgi:GMP reductase
MKSLTYSDVCLVPNYSECESRSNCDTTVNLFGIKYKLPIIPANMKAVISESQCKWLSENGYFYIMHRFDVDTINFVDMANREGWPLISISLGVNSKDVETLHRLKRNGNRGRVHYITLDIAHGHSSLMKNMIHSCKTIIPEAIVIAGNVATPSAVRDLASWGADMVKVGIGQGSPCTTKDKTGFTMPMFSCLKECSKLIKGDSFKEQDCSPELIPIIADGGIKCNGDIAKALVAGASMVMAGGAFACCSDSPAHSIEIEGVIHKAYFGSASFENKKTNTHIEGILKNVPTCGMDLKSKLIEIKEDLQSSISYAGGKDLTCFQKSVQYRLS